TRGFWTCRAQPLILAAAIHRESQSGKRWVGCGLSRGARERGALVRKLQVLGTVCFVGAAVVLQTGVASAEEWSLVVPESLSSDAAVALAVEDLVETGAALGHAFSVRDDRQLPAGNAIL